MSLGYIPVYPPPGTVVAGADVQLVGLLDPFTYFNWKTDYLPALGLVLVGAVVGGLVNKKRRTKGAVVGSVVGTGLGAGYLSARWMLHYKRNF